ncbi:MAG: tRNA (guanosine(37)-N1)-methyltransferase TrmD, partial [Pseudomonadota bacterium]|nr:tRNA (guanosine(37)-N1)-methyltransferase TrmD [Pseudomonadota bacterium]
LEARDIRDHAVDRHRSVDDTPYGGGAGMVMRADIVDAALEAANTAGRPEIYLSPRGRRLDQAMAEELAAGDGVVLLCGRYEGLDERVIEARGMQEVSLGDFVLSGGEYAAMSLIDACVRLLPGVLGAAESLAEESFQTGLLEYPQYTRPAQWRDRTVPDILLSGHHERIQHWRLTEAQRVTRERRVDLWSRYVAGLNEARVSS